MTTIDTIRAEIERQMNFYDGKEREVLDDPKQFTYALLYQGHQRMCAKLLSFLSTLESEKPINLDGLEEEIDKYREEHLFDMPAFQQVARYFAKWGAEHARGVILINIK